VLILIGKKSVPGYSFQLLETQLFFFLKCLSGYFLFVGRQIRMFSKITSFYLLKILTKAHQYYQSPVTVSTGKDGKCEFGLDASLRYKIISTTIFALDLCNLIFLSSATVTAYTYHEVFDVSLRLQSTLLVTGTILNVVCGLHFMISGEEQLALLKYTLQFSTSLKGTQFPSIFFYLLDELPKFFTSKQVKASCETIKCSKDAHRKHRTIICTIHFCDNNDKKIIHFQQHSNEVKLCLDYQTGTLLFGNFRI